MKEEIAGYRVGVIAGGLSAEREVSLKSGEAVYNALSEGGYNAVFIDAGTDIYRKIIDEGIQMAFIALHGGWGEDGAIQGMLEVMGVPYTGSGILASALAMDKEVSKKIFLQHGLNVPSYTVTGKQAVNTTPPIPSPWVIKPSGEGSSVGVSIVNTEEELEGALSEALRYSSSALLEEYIQGKEVQIAVLDDEVLGGVEVRTGRRFYDYKAKYTPGMTEYIIPPEIGEELYLEAAKTGLCAHNALGCKGATRVDLIIDNAGKIFTLEVNTIPGMTETSLLPKIAGFAGYSFLSLLEAILLDAVKRNLQAQ